MSGTPNSTLLKAIFSGETDLVRHALNVHAGRIPDEAIVAAGAVGDLGIVREVLKSRPFSEKVLGEALHVAFELRNDEAAKLLHRNGGIIDLSIDYGYGNNFTGDSVREKLMTRPEIAGEPVAKGRRERPGSDIIDAMEVFSARRRKLAGLLAERSHQKD